MSSENGSDEETKREISKMKEILQENLHSYESVIVYFLQVLVWEKPVHSSVLFFILHLMFWYVKASLAYIGGLLCGLWLIILWLDMWKDKIWPEIRAVAPDPNEEDWGELHPRLPMLPELCQIIAEAIVTMKTFGNDALAMRQNQPGKFFASVVATCTITALIGHAVPGLLLAYFFMLCCVVLPVIWYRRVMERLYNALEPFFMQLQYSLKPKMKRAKKHYPKPARSLEGAQVEVITDSSEDDDEMSFVKTLDAKTADLIARALTDESELSDSDESLLAHECPSLSSHCGSLDGDKDTQVLPEVILPEAIPKYDDPGFKEYTREEDDGIGLSPEEPAVPPNTESQTPGGNVNQIIQNAAASVLQETVSNVLQSTATTLADWSKRQADTDEKFTEEIARMSKNSTPSSEDSFVILDSQNY